MNLAEQLCINVFNRNCCEQDHLLTALLARVYQLFRDRTKTWTAPPQNEREGSIS